jgi:hypothetical protein
MTLRTYSTYSRPLAEYFSKPAARSKDFKLPFETHPRPQQAKRAISLQRRGTACCSLKGQPKLTLSNNRSKSPEVFGIIFKNSALKHKFEIKHVTPLASRVKRNPGGY